MWLAERRNPGTSAEGFADTLRAYHTILTRTVILTQALVWASIRTSTPTILQPANQLPIPTLAMQQACRRLEVHVPVFEWRALRAGEDRTSTWGRPLDDAVKELIPKARRLQVERMARSLERRPYLRFLRLDDLVTGDESYRKLPFLFRHPYLAHGGPPFAMMCRMGMFDIDARRRAREGDGPVCPDCLDRVRRDEMHILFWCKAYATERQRVNAKVLHCLPQLTENGYMLPTLELANILLGNLMPGHDAGQQRRLQRSVRHELYQFGTRYRTLERERTRGPFGPRPTQRLQLTQTREVVEATRGRRQFHWRPLYQPVGFSASAVPPWTGPDPPRPLLRDCSSLELIRRIHVGATMVGVRSSIPGQRPQWRQFRFAREEPTLHTLALSLCATIVCLPPNATQGIRVATESRQLLLWITGRVPNRRLESFFGCLWRWLDIHRIPLLLSRRIPGLRGQFDEILVEQTNSSLSSASRPSG